MSSILRSASRPAPRRPDVVQRAVDFVSTRSFQLLSRARSADALDGPLRVAYGPLDKPPKLARPVVMVPGFMMEAESFDRMAQRLADEPSNGPVVVYVAGEDAFRIGSVRGREATAQELQGAKIFELQYQEPFGSPSAKAPQIGRALERLKAVTGSKSLDVVTHSEGGTDLRLYLDGPKSPTAPSIERAVLVGPASHGTLVGNIGAVVGHIKGANVAAGELAVGSPLNERLSAGWERQRAQVPGGVTLIGISGAPTLAPSRGRLPFTFRDGDGFMPASALPLPGARVETSRGPHRTPAAHLWEIQYSGVINQAFGALAG